MQIKKCSIAGCDRPLKARGFCGLHYQRFIEKRDMTAPIKQTKFCTVLDCNKKHLAHGLCRYHYDRIHRHKPLIPQPKKCSVLNCLNPYYANNYCRCHYYQNYYQNSKRKGLKEE